MTPREKRMLRKSRGLRNRFEESEEVDPMSFVSNMSDVMLVLAVGIMLALVVNHFQIDVTTPAGTTQTLQESITPEDAEASFTEEDLDNMKDNAVDDPGNMQKAGEIYYDEATGQYYIIEDTGE